MYTYSINQIMALRDKYRDPPYPGFSLDDVCRKNKQKGNAILKRGENAWAPKTAMTVDEGVSRLVQGSLNKLAPEKYSEVIDHLRQPQLFEEGAMSVVIDHIFGKALLEPGYSELYARLCFDMARFEYTLVKNLGSPEQNAEKRKSKFRDGLVRRAQLEFQESDTVRFEGLQGEELEEAKQKYIKRKRANIKFVGRLFMNRVLSDRIMMTILTTMTRLDSPTLFFPDEANVEVLTELLETIGLTIDTMSSDHRAHMDKLFGRLKQLVSGSNASQYTHRIRFKLLDIIELRDNDWVPRVERMGLQTPMTLLEQERMQQQQKLLKLGPRSPTSIFTPTRKGGMVFPKFPDSPSPTGSSTIDKSQPVSWRNVVAPKSDTPTTRAPISVPPASLGAKIKGMCREWISEGAEEVITDWAARFRYFGMSDEALTATIISEIVNEACIVSRANAQLEATEFLMRGLQFKGHELLSGFAKGLSKAIEEDVLSDSPKFCQRFATLVQFACSTDIASDIYRGAAVVLFQALDSISQIEGMDDPVDMEPLVDVWDKLPVGQVDASLVQTINELRQLSEMRAQLGVRLTKRLVERGLITKNEIEKWVAKGSAASSALADALRKAGAL